MKGGETVIYLINPVEAIREKCTTKCPQDCSALNPSCPVQVQPLYGVPPGPIPL